MAYFPGDSEIIPFTMCGSVVPHTWCEKAVAFGERLSVAFGERLSVAFGERLSVAFGERLSGRLTAMIENLLLILA